MRNTPKTHCQQIRHDNLHPLLPAKHLDLFENDQHIWWSTTFRVRGVFGGRGMGVDGGDILILQYQNPEGVLLNTIHNPDE